MNNIIPVILTGGIGTRLWPLSRKTYPKQFSSILGDRSLFQESSLRLLSSDIIKFSPNLIVTRSDFRFIVSEQMQSVGVVPGHIMIEPEGRNTAPAILAACFYSLKIDPDSILIVTPSDHVLPNVKAFHRSIRSGLRKVVEGNVVTFGIKPKKPETGYGYLELSSQDQNPPIKLSSFVEKPTKKEAKEMLEKGNYLWNSGIFMFRAKDMITLFRKHAAELVEPVLKSVELSKLDLGFIRLEQSNWSSCSNISIDYAIMEKIDNLYVVPFYDKWSDLGGWDAVWEEMKHDKNSVATSINAHSFDCSHSLLRSESKNQQLIGIGLENIIAVATPDAVLVASKDQSQKLKIAVDKLKEEKIWQAEMFQKDYRPWGWFETLAIDKSFQVKRIFVKPGAALSLQSHNNRSEHWVVVVGTANVTVNDCKKTISEGESVYIPLKAIHRLENSTDVPLILIEVQTGSYLGEDDIIRYEDLYARENE